MKCWYIYSISPPKLEDYTSKSAGRRRRSCVREQSVDRVQESVAWCACVRLYNCFSVTGHNNVRKITQRAASESTVGAWCWRRKEGLYMVSGIATKYKQKNINQQKRISINTYIYVQQLLIYSNELFFSYNLTIHHNAYIYIYMYSIQMFHSKALATKTLHYMHALQTTFPGICIHRYMYRMAEARKRIERAIYTGVSILEKPCKTNQAYHHSQRRVLEILDDHFIIHDTAPSNLYQPKTH